MWRAIHYITRIIRSIYGSDLDSKTFTAFLCPHKMTRKQKRSIQLLSIVLGCMTLDDYGIVIIYSLHHLLITKLVLSSVEHIRYDRIVVFECSIVLYKFVLM